MNVSMQPTKWTIDFPDPERNKYPAGIIRFRDHTGSEILINLPQEQFESFIQNLNRKTDE